MRYVALAGLLTAASALPFIGTLQSIATKGHLKCGGKPAETVKVKLFEEEICEFGWSFLIHHLSCEVNASVVDDLLDQKYTDSNGLFEMSGKKKEFTTIDPAVVIYHKCNYKGVSHDKSWMIHS
ncbi:hypothetical protein GCK32_013080 [Trichostrongylus colubriformis]|uniref:Transthyretin-like family protein n=1 Tax=Trichostrongylus colubriformis TaxID=6319 RepID=A0AAN8F2Y8_TRICO